MWFTDKIKKCIKWTDQCNGHKELLLLLLLLRTLTKLHFWDGAKVVVKTFISSSLLHIALFFLYMGLEDLCVAEKEGGEKKWGTVNIKVE